MSTLAIWIIVVAVATVPLMLASLFICAPKWWREEVSGRLPELPNAFYNERFWKVIRIGVLILASPITIPISLTAWLIFGWFQAAAALIEMACPYESEWPQDGHKQRRDLRNWADIPSQLFTKQP